MADPRFFCRAGPFLLEELACLSNASIANKNLDNLPFEDVKSLSDAGPRDVSFLDNKRYADSFMNSQAGACVVENCFVERAPKGMALLVTDTPYLGYAKIAEAFYPPRNDPTMSRSSEASIDPRACVSDSAHISAKAVIQAGVEIGPGTYIGSGSVVGAGVIIGADTKIGPNVCLSHCFIGDRVTIHAGVCIGQDGFGFAISPNGHYKVPQLGRVIVQEDVEIGANTTIDRGTSPDTVIGAGTKIDNLVQIGHNVRIGKGCIIVGQVGISGSTKIGDFVMIGGQAGFAGHLQIGSGSQVAAKSGVTKNLEAGSKVGGFPAKSIRSWLRELALIERLGKRKSN